MRRLSLLARFALAPSAAFLMLLAAATAQAQQSTPVFFKNFFPDTIGPGSASELVFTIDNSENSQPTSNLAFTDTLPAAVTIASPASVSNDCGGTVTAPAGGDTITLTGGTLGSFENCQIRVDVTSSTLGIHTNVSGDLTSSQGNSGNATADLTVAADRPGFSKSFSPSTVQLGAYSTLTFTIDNSANESAAGNLVFSDTLPAGLVVDGPADVVNTCDGSVSASPGSNQISLSLGFVGALATCTISVDVTANAAGSLENRSGELTSTPGGPSVSSGIAVAALQVNADELALRKTFTDDPAPPGGTATLRFTLSNLSRGGTATGVTFTDDLDATLSGLAAVPPLPTDPCGAGSTLSGPSPLTLTGGTLGPGETCTFSVQVQVPAGAAPGTYPNTTSSVSGDVDGSPAVGAAATDDLVVDVAPILTKTFTDDPAVPGGNVTLEFTLTNSSDSFDATDIAFFDVLSDLLTGTTATALPASGFCGPGSTMSQVNNLPMFDDVSLRMEGGSLAPSASCTFQVTLQLPPSAPGGNHLNTTTEVTATVDGSTRTGAPATDTLFVVSAPSLNKDFLDDPVLPGDTVTLEFTLEHPGEATGDATGIAFTDDLDATLSGLVSVSGTQGDVCGTGSQLSGTTSLSFTGGTLSPGESCTFSATLQVPAGAAVGDHVNTSSTVQATVSGIATESAPASDTLSVSILELTKSFIDDPVLPGGTVTLRFTIDNLSGTTGATDISFQDNLDGALSGLVATGLPIAACGGTASGTSTITFSGGTLAAGASCTFDVVLQVPVGAASATYANVTNGFSATINSTTVAMQNASDDLVVDANVLEFSKSFTDDPVRPGDTVTLEFTISNLSGSDTITGITFTDDLDATLSGLASVSGTQNDVCGAGSQLGGTSLLTLTGGNLAPGTSCTFSATLQVPAGVATGTTATNTTSQVTGSAGALAVEGPPASDDLVVDLAVLSKTFDGPAAAGGTAVLTFTIDNLDDSAKSSLAFTDDLGATLPGLVATGLPASGICGPGSQVSGTSLLTFSGGNLAAGASCSFDVTVQVPAAAAPGSYPNTTSALSEGGLQVGAPASASLAIEPPPAFAKSFTPAAVAVGDASTLTLTIDNTASVLAATALTVTDNLPAGLEVAATPNAATTCGGGTLTAPAGATSISYSGGSVAAGASCTIQADVTTTVAGDLVNTTGDLTSSLGNSGTASATLDVISPLQIAKSFAPDNVAPGGTTTLSFTIDNTDASPATGVAFTDDLDAALPGLTATGLPLADACGAGSQLSGSSVLTLTGGTLPAGGSCTFNVTVQVPADAAAGDYVNTSSPVNGTIGGSAITGNMASDTLTVASAPAFSKAFDSTTLIVGVASPLTFTIDNSANAVPADNLAFTDDLPDGMFVADPANTATTCGGTVSATPGSGIIQFSGGSVAGGATCTVSVDIVVTVLGQLENVSGGLSSTLGSSGAATATIQAQRAGSIPALGPLATLLAVLLTGMLGAAAAHRRGRSG